VLDSFDHCLAVVIHAPQLDAVALLFSIQKDIGRLESRRDRIADAAQIDDVCPANPTIERNMGVPDDDEVRLAASQPLLQLVIAVLGPDTRSVVSSWRSMNAEQARAIG
jgi:hypothetical protein